MRITSLSISLAWGLILAGPVRAQEKISGPFTHQNLSVFLIHGQSGSKQYLALTEAVEQRKVFVHETEQVNELAAENVSNQPVFIQRGDLVRGGEQDRMITNDFVLPPKSGRLPLGAFCVEQGRSTKRGTESPRIFDASIRVLGAAVFNPWTEWNQVSVWQGVKALQDVLVQKLGHPELVRANASPSSLPLTLASPPVEEAVSRYVSALGRVADGKSDVVGAAFVVNGVVRSADVYASARLFNAMWPKLLKGAAVEAIRRREVGPPAAVPAAAITAFLKGAEQGRESVVNVDRRVALARRESATQVTIESRESGNWVHRSTISR